MMREKMFQWKIGGEAGMGIKVTGGIFSKMCSRHGMHIVDYSEYPSLIRGGHNTFQVIVSKEPIHALRKGVDFLVCLNSETIERHVNEVAPFGIILYDPKDLPVVPRQRKVFWRPIPFEDLAIQSGGAKLMKNSVALGASVAMMSCQFDILEEILSDTFIKKGKSAQENIRSAKAGFDYIQRQFKESFWTCPIHAQKTRNRMVISGNEALSLGAIAGGLQCYFAYPMTPATTILTTLSQLQHEHGMIVRQCEDEISVINEAIGASFAGARTMVGTSGGGFSLMVEAMGLSAMTETPLVIVDAQRPGPSTGLPTWTGQGDLRFVIHAAQDEFPRAVFTPGDVEECFYFTAHALNIAEIFQIPVIILTDKYLGEGEWSHEIFDPKPIEVHRGDIITAQSRRSAFFPRYGSTPTGISKRPIPGLSRLRFIANSDEHDQFGFTSEDHLVRIEQTRKRFRKVPYLSLMMPGPIWIGPKNAQLTLVGWGSTKGAMLDAAAMMNEKGMSVSVLHVRSPWPFPRSALSRELRKTQKTLVIEGNYSGQLTGLIEQHLHQSPDDVFVKYDGRPFYPEEIMKKGLSLL